jgi:hypothetical protein
MHSGQPPPGPSRPAQSKQYKEPAFNQRFIKAVTHLGHTAEEPAASCHAMKGPRCRGSPVQEGGCCCSAAAAADSAYLPCPPPPLQSLQHRGACGPPWRTRIRTDQISGVRLRRQERPRRRHPSPSARPTALSENGISVNVWAFWATWACQGDIFVRFGLVPGPTWRIHSLKK